jgi:DNA mismatch endonuclease, patch repair protein
MCFNCDFVIKFIMDKLTKKQRSELMSKIRGKNTYPEIAVRKFIWKLGCRYRLHCKTLPGTPDLVFRSLKKVLFVNGCFWHGHSCRRKHFPKTRIKFWRTKIMRNRQRDQMNLAKLSNMGWDCLTIWECEVKKLDTLNLIESFLFDSGYSVKYNPDILRSSTSPAVSKVEEIGVKGVS